MQELESQLVESIVLPHKLVQRQLLEPSTLPSWSQASATQTQPQYLWTYRLQSMLQPETVRPWPLVMASISQSFGVQNLLSCLRLWQKQRTQSIALNNAGAMLRNLGPLWLPCFCKLTHMELWIPHAGFPHQMPCSIGRSWEELSHNPLQCQLLGIWTLL